MPLNLKLMVTKIEKRIDHFEILILSFGKLNKSAFVLSKIFQIPKNVFIL